MIRFQLAVLVLLLTSGSHAYVAAAESDYFRIRVVDEQTGRGVPLVQLRTVHNVSYWTDSAGMAAIGDPTLFGADVFFHVWSHGYEFPKDGFGYRGARLTVKPGKSATLKVRRVNIAERLYRITGGGVYHDSVLLGDRPPVQQPLLNGRVFGSDSVVNAVFRDRIYWFWGDTNRPKYPLGNFHVPGAVSELPGKSGLDPDMGVNLNYFLGKDGFAKATCEMPGQGPTWIGGLTVLRDEGKERMFATYVKIKPPLSVYERGIAEFDDQAKAFTKLRVLGKDARVWPDGHPLYHREGEIDYVYFTRGLPLVRTRANVHSYLDPSAYEVYTYESPNTEGEKSKGEELGKVIRDADGQLVWAWRKNATPLTREREERFRRAGLIHAEERVFQLRDVDADRNVTIHGASVAWNPFRKRWSMIALEVGGKPSFLGEIYYAEAERPEGPWARAIKVVTHEKYSFYNPKQHPMLAQQNGRFVYFEGTYTQMFSGNNNATPRYDYNQVMYRLDLSGDWVKKLAPTP